MGVYLRAKFEVSSIILITFRRGGGGGGGGGVILTGNINSLSEAIRIYQENLKKSTIKFYTSKQYKILFEFHIFPKTSCPWLHIQSNLQKQIPLPHLPRNTLVALTLLQFVPYQKKYCKMD